MYMYCIERSVISTTRITRVNNKLLAMISLHMLTFRLIVTVAEFGSLVILIHNTLLGENDQQYKNYTSIPQFLLIPFHIQRFKFIDFMVIELH